jgi:UDP-N-acetylmuramoyl-L-alanyl-D-glutamate--2,6-diaminopimelate ligase
VPTTTLATDGGADAHWRVADVVPDGLGHRFSLHGPDGAMLRLRTGLPGLFNVSNAALAVLMVHAGGVDLTVLQRALDEADPLTVEVPGRMELVGTRPASIVDFAHNPDALERALRAVRPAGPGRVIVVFGATGQRDAGKRPAMGGIAARLADVVIITDDDPHDEDSAAIRADVLRGARGVAATAAAGAGTGALVEEVFPRTDAIFRAVELAREEDVILVAGRGHEVWQEVRGVNLPLDDREELRRARALRGFPGQGQTGIES